MHRFWSDEGYAFEPDLPALFRALKESRASSTLVDKLVVGIITNSDDRVPEILSSFGLKVSPLRYGVPLDQAAGVGGANDDDYYDVDFHCISYDVGFEKPDRRIFAAAEEMLREVITAREGTAPSDSDLAAWDKLYVGDEWQKDVQGALSAGWHPVFFNGEGGGSSDIAALADLGGRPLADVFKQHEIVRVDSVKALVEFITNKTRD